MAALRDKIMILALDVGATNIKVALFDTDSGTVLTERKIVPTNAVHGFSAIKSAIYGAIEPYAGVVSFVAVASAGDINERGIVTYATENLPGMTGFDYVKFVADSFSLPATALNDAQAALLGEIRYGVGNIANRTIMLTLGSGVGGGYCVDSKLCSSAQNDYARFGHIVLRPGGRECNCGKKGCIEVYLSGRALHADAAKRGIDGDELFAKYLFGSPERVLFVQDFQRNFQLALDKINDVCPFEACIVGGGVVDWIGSAFDNVFEPINTRIVKAVLGNYAGVYGALAYCLDKEVGL